VAGKKNKEPNKAADEPIKKSKAKDPKKSKSKSSTAKKDLDLSSEVEFLSKQLIEAKDESLRNQAEMQNIIRRSERDVQNAHKYSLDKFVAELLPVVDNLERALESIDQDKSELKSLAEGVELTLKSFQDLLERQKVVSVNPKGEIFNPDLHQAMSILEEPSVAPNTVIDVFQKGYTLNGRLVRPAMVVVAKGEAQ
jgi:molecular chaperone GrpE|tara:strand:- start:5202 stop:5789 length:588 start_codon:yes stop_codon:yes gene_type:complete